MGGTYPIRDAASRKLRLDGQEASSRRLGVEHGDRAVLENDDVLPQRTDHDSVDRRWEDVLGTDLKNARSRGESARGVGQRGADIVAF